jgi:hypothetical protein
VINTTVIGLACGGATGFSAPSATYTVPAPGAFIASCAIAAAGTSTTSVQVTVTWTGGTATTGTVVVPAP